MNEQNQSNEKKGKGGIIAAIIAAIAVIVLIIALILGSDACVKDESDNDDRPGEGQSIATTGKTPASQMPSADPKETETEKQTEVTAPQKDITLSLKYNSLGNGKCVVIGISDPECEEIVIPETNPETGETVIAIAVRSFENNNNIRYVYIPDTVTDIGSHAFLNCQALETVNVPSGVDEIYSYTFYGCTSLRNVTLEKGLVSIGESAFRGCSALTELTLPDGLKEIGFGSISNCTSLKKVMIPDSVTTIGQWAFEECGEDLVFYCAAESQPSGWHSAWNKNGYPVNWGETFE